MVYPGSYGPLSTANPLCLPPPPCLDVTKTPTYTLVSHRNGSLRFLVCLFTCVLRVVAKSCVSKEKRSAEKLGLRWRPKTGICWVIWPVQAFSATPDWTRGVAFVATQSNQHTQPQHSA